MISVSHTELGVEAGGEEAVGIRGPGSGRGLAGDVFRFVGCSKGPRSRC